MRTPLLLAVAMTLLFLVVAHGDSPGSPGSNGKPKKPAEDSCPLPTPENIKCVQKWACQNVIRLDLRCLLRIPGLLNGGGGLLSGVLGG